MKRSARARASTPDLGRLNGLAVAGDGAGAGTGGNARAGATPSCAVAQAVRT